MASSRDQALLRRGLDPITTRPLASYDSHLSTPISAESMAPSHVRSSHTPRSVIQPYNPQEWASSPVPAQAPLPAQDWPRPLPSDLQASPQPPPPYSPPRSRRQRPASTTFEHAVASTSFPPPRTILTVGQQPPPEPTANPLFPSPRAADGGVSSTSRRPLELPNPTRGADDDRVLSPPGSHPPTLTWRRSECPAPFHQEPQRMCSPTSDIAQPTPPAARRAASTGAIDTPTCAFTHARSTSQTRWPIGIPLPPPPPGPPPSGSRSQSVQSMDRNNAPMISPPTRRPPPSAVCSLGPVPPTPADWVDEPVQPAQPVLGRSPGLTIDTAAAAAAAAAAATSNTANVPDPLPSSGSASGRLSRAGAVRHDKTIIQRRTESRCRHTPEGSIDTVPRPRQVADIVVLNSPHTNPATTTKKPTPRSGGGTLHEAHPVSDSLPQGDSRNSTPRASGSTNCYQAETASPPFPSHLAKVGQSSAKTVQHMMPKALPTPPPRPRSESSSRRNNSFRPPLPDTPPVFRRLAVSQSADQFEAATLERVQTFTAMEAAASTDADRVRLFADFIVNESRIRRERYSSAIGEMGSEILDLTRDLFRPVEGSRRESATSQEEWTPASTDPTTSRRDSAGSVMRTDELSHSAPTSSKAPASSKIPTSPSGGPSITANWSTNYMPSLSPILSMSVSDRHENGSSRGRPPSRWWELDSLGDGPRVLGRSKRESKYMGVPRDQWVEEEPIRGEASDNGSTSAYPPEKTGWLDQGEASSKPQGFPLSDAPSSSSVLEPLDVSRLITMPPPYPRHHPAENNNHPELTTIRCSVRMLGDLTQANKSNESFANASAERREKFSKAASERRQHLRANLQKEIGAGNLNYSDAAVIESDSEQQERDRKKELEKTEYERFQNEVVIPLNDLLTRRITLATSLFDDLSHHLFDNGEIDADMPQEEGDDRPELLEKLTLLKWIFETRETLHRTIYDILSDRNSRYCDVVVTPYRLSSNAEKLKSAEAFFAEDAARREQAFAMEILGRATLFRSVMEEAVERGVAMQLSAFWDIAPPLRDLLDSIPSDFDNFGVQIPPSEYEENPSYQHHPLQYLYGLLQHMEKSTYRFIESHTNLLCLLHEVKEATVNAEARVLATKREDSDGTILDDEYCEERVRMMRQSETKRLTADLKEKVRAVQDQWNSALANRIRTSKELTRAWLLQTGGWDESLEESEGFGGE